MYWHIDRNIIDEKYGTADIVEAVRAAGHTPIIVDNVNTPFENITEPNIIYGTVGFCHSKYGRSFVPGTLGHQNLNINEYYPHFEKWLLNDDYVCIPFGSLRNNPQRFLDMFNGAMFIRPVSSKKVFTGQVLKDDIEFEINSMRQLTSVMDDTMCLISSAKDFGTEYRFFIGNRKVISYSSYSWTGEPYTYDLPVGMMDTVLDIANNHWLPDIAFVVDMTMYDGQPRMIELNSFSSAGMYGCDVQKIIKEVSDIVISEFFI